MNWKNLFRFSPRAGREEFAAVGLVCNLLTFGNMLLSFWLMTGNLPLARQVEFQLLTFPVSLLAAWVGLALYSRRLHDFNLSFWWYIIYVGVTFALAFTSRMGAAVVSLLGIALWAFFALKKGPAQENRFGQTEPFFAQHFGRNAFYLTVALGILLSSAIVSYSHYVSVQSQRLQRAQAAQPRQF